ncbi:MAG: response regulator [Candidatus Hydrogenedentes bacterium]|nr:response regulator [Candidatus Hydrogenedentota bacterium]
MAIQRILVVDDEPDVVSLLERTLRADGFEVLTAFDGIGALDVIMAEKPDLVLLDIMMPMMSGYEVCAQVKSNPQTKDIPIVCLSSAHTPDARAQSLKAGAVELIAKPFFPDELLAQIRRHLPAGDVENVG